MNAGDEDRSPANICSDTRSINILKSNKQDSLFLKCFIFNIEVNCLVDTGSTICILHPRKYNLLPPNMRPEIKKTNTKLCLADGGVINTMGYIDLPIQVGNFTTVQKFTVADIDVPAVIGYDFLHSHKCTLDMGEEVLTLDENQIKCIKESQMSSLFKISLTEKVTIPPKTEVITIGKIEGDSSSIMNALVQPLQSKHLENILVAKSLVDPSRGYVPIRLANITNHEQIMKQFTCIASCESVELSQDKSVNRGDRVMKVDSCEKIDKLPVYLKELKDKSGALLNDDQKCLLDSLLKRHINTFSKTKDDLGRANVIKHKINTGDAHPIKQQPRRLPLTKRDDVDREIQRLLDCGIIEASKSPWASPIVPVTKKDGSTRLCIDYRALNNVTIKDSYPLPRIDDSLDALRGSKWFSVLDLSSGYFQVQMEETDKEKTAFTSTKGLFQFNVMAMGLCNGVATFQRLMEYILAGLNWQTCLIYIDDIIVFADSFESHLARLSQVLDRIAEQGLKVSPKKCFLFQRRVSFLGHIVSTEGISADPTKIESVKTWPSPKTITDVRSFMGTCSYYRRFIKDFAAIARPMHKLTEKNCPFNWTEECETAFQKLKITLITAPVLGFPDMSKHFLLDTDASGFGIGAVLSQVTDGKEVVIAYFSKALSKAQRQYCVTRRELLAVILGVKHFHHYLYGTRFIVRTDHGSLTWLLRFKNPEGQMARWLQMLNTYNFEIIHRPGRQHGNADGLSRRPCFPCNYCSRQDQKEMNSSSNETIEHLYRTKKQESKSTPSLDDDNFMFWFQHKSNEEMQMAQTKDLVLLKLYNLKMENKDRPDWADVSIENVKLKKYWSQWDRILLINNVLYRKWINTTTEENILQLLLPEVWKNDVMKMLHDDPQSGHLGIHRTVSRAQNRFYWVDYKPDIIKWVHNCTICNSRKQPHRKAKSKMKQYCVGAPMERVALDLIGPLPLSHKGNKYVLIVSDYFTKWAEGYPIPDMETTTIVDNFVTNFVCRFGVPRQIHTDQGRQFESGLFKELCKKFSIDKTRTTAFRPQSDGLVERFNRTLEDILSKYVSQNQKDWDEQLPWALMAYRSSEHDTTKFSPCMLMLGREIELPVDLIYGPHPQSEEFPDETQAVFAYSDNMQKRMWKVQEKARSNILKASDRQKRQYDVRVNQHRYQTGDVVWLHTLLRVKQRSPKLQRNWDGPYFVTKVISDVIYKIQKSPSSKFQVVHHDRLKPFYGEVENWVKISQDVAMLDKMSSQSTESTAGPSNDNPEK